MHPTADCILCPVDDFMSAYMPFIPDRATTKQSVEELVQSNRLRRSGRAIEFADFNPQVWKGASVYEYFRRLERIAADISRCTVDGRRAQHIYRSEKCPETEDYTASFQPAVNAVLGDLEDAVLCRFTLSEKDCPKVDEMHKSIVADSIKILNNDARRSFIFGMTFYGDTVSLWYHSRSHSAVSEPLNFVENAKVLIKLFMAFTFATPEEMGYDPSISLYSLAPASGGSNSFTYTVPFSYSAVSSDAGAGTIPHQNYRYYRTVKSIFSRAPNLIRGRMVRIWEVVEVESVNAPTPIGAPSRVLKDVWIDAESRTEMEVQVALFTDIEEFLRTPQTPARLEKFRRSLAPYAESYKEYFLQITGASEGTPTKQIVQTSRYRTGQLSTLGYPILQEPEVPPTPSTLRPLKRCCTVFSELCVAISDLDALGDVVDIVEQTLIPLRLMCGAGWVHRDISCGNLLARKDTSGKWNIKLADFEYARKFPRREDQHLACTAIVGTPPYMPHEVCTRAYIYPGTQDQRVVHSPSHDVESLWWLLLKKVVTCGYYNTASDPDAQQSLRDVLYLLFEKMGDERAHVFTRSIGAALQARLPPALVAFAEPLDALRSALRRRFRNIRKYDVTWDKEEHVPVYGYFDAALRLVRAHPAAGWEGMSVMTMAPPAVPMLYAPELDVKVSVCRGSGGGGKRKRASDEENIAAPAVPMLYAPELDVKVSVNACRGSGGGAKRKRASDEENIGEAMERVASGAIKKCKIEPSSMRHALFSRTLH